MKTSYEVEIWKTRVRKQYRKPYQVRWVVDGKEFSRSFISDGLAESFKADLTRAARKGEAFDIDSGLPVSMARRLVDKASSVTWMMHAKEYAMHKWPSLAGTSRISVAEVLTTVTLVLLPKKGRDRPNEKTMRTALRRWAFNGQKRDEPEPDHIATALKWLDMNSPAVSVLADPDTLRAVLNACARRLDGKRQRPTTWLVGGRCFTTSLSTQSPRNDSARFRWPIRN